MSIGIARIYFFHKAGLFEFQQGANVSKPPAAATNDADNVCHGLNNLSLNINQPLMKNVSALIGFTAGSAGASG